MKLKTAVSSFALSLCMVLLLASCTAGTTDIVGKWELSEVTVGGAQLSSSEVSAMKMSVAFSEDGSFIFAVGDDEFSGTYSTEDVAEAEYTKSVTLNCEDIKYESIFLVSGNLTITALDGDGMPAVYKFSK